MSIDDAATHAHVESLELEIASLRTQVTRLQDQLNASSADTVTRRGVLSAETESLLRDVPRTGLDESDRVTRALTEAVAQSLRSVADGVFAGLGAFDRRRDQLPSGDTKRDSDRVGVDELAAGVATGVLDVIGAQGRIIRQFAQAYDNHPPRRATERQQTSN